MRQAPLLLFCVLLLIGLGSCSASKGTGKRHKRPSGGSGKGCDCPSFGQAIPSNAIWTDRFSMPSEC